MSSTSSLKNVTLQAQRRISILRRQILTVQYLCSGSLIRKTLTCGQSYCHCKKNPAFRHGPYNYWHRMHRGRLLSRVLSPTQVVIVRQGIQNYRQARSVLKKWELETVKVIEASKDATRR